MTNFELFLIMLILHLSQTLFHFSRTVSTIYNGNINSVHSIKIILHNDYICWPFSTFSISKRDQCLTRSEIYSEQNWWISFLDISVMVMKCQTQGKPTLKMTVTWWKSVWHGNTLKKRRQGKQIEYEFHK